MADTLINARDYGLLTRAIHHDASLVRLDADPQALADCQRRGLVALCWLPASVREPGGYPVLFAGVSAVVAYNILVFHDDGEDTDWWYQMWGVYGIFPDWAMPTGGRGDGVWSVIMGIQDLHNQQETAKAETSQGHAGGGSCNGQ